MKKQLHNRMEEHPSYMVHGAEIPAPVSFILKLIFTSASVGMVVILVLSNI
jgi:hypothetical protein